MGTKVPLGSAEGQRREFKSSEALRKPFSISREVVAMLNASGGDIWVGVGEAHGRAVVVEELKDVERKRQDLLNHLIEVVEPRLRSEVVQVETVEHEGKQILRVRVDSARDRGPFAQLKEGGRHYFIRIDHRVRPMTREEVFGPSPGPVQKATERLTYLRDEILKRGRSGMWIGIRPTPELALDLQKEELALLLLDPTRSDNRESGWNFRFPPILQVRRKLRRQKLEYGSEENKKTIIWKDGCVEFWTSILGLRHRTDPVKEIYPLALLEYSTSIMRLAKTVYSSLSETRPVDVFVDLALTRVEGWHLPSYAPDTYGYAFEHEPPRELDDGQSMAQVPLRLPWEEFEKAPDHAGYLLVRALYQDFGLPEDRIPRHYDRIARRLVFDE
jgi:hypothetical protein